MQKKYLPIDFEILEYYGEAFREHFQKTMNEAFPANHELNSSCFEKNDLFRRLRDFINETMGPELAFHPKKLYVYVFEYLRFKERDEFSRLQKHPDGAVLWKVTKTFPEMLFRLLGYQSLKDFLRREASQLGEAVLARQRQYFQQFYSSQQKESRRALAFYHCYISDLRGIKTGKMALFNDNTIELILNDRDQSHYHGLVNKNTNWSTMDLWKIPDPNFKVSSRKTVSNQAFEVSFKFLPEEDFQEHIFIFGTFSAINRNDYDIKNPARVAGPIMLEWVNIKQLENTSLLSLPLIKHNEADPIIAAKVSSRRIEEVKTYTRKSKAKRFLDRRKEELSMINAHNHRIQNPADCIGKYFCLVYSKSHDALRKIFFTVHHDLTVTCMATKYVNDHTEIRYMGNVVSFFNGLFSFRADKELNRDHLKGTFLCKSKKKPMYGLLSGIFKDIPKAGRAILIPVDESLKAFTSIEKPGIIPIESDEYEKLDQLFNITRFYAGAFLKNERLDSNLIINDSVDRFRQLLCQKKGDFIQLQGIYEEFYYDLDEEVIRKDYLLIRHDGAAFMVGTYQYRGAVKNLGNKFLIDLRSLRREKEPVFYLVHQKANPWKLYPGVFGTVTEGHREIAGNTVYLHKISSEETDAQHFFQTYQDKVERIMLYSDEFTRLNQQLNNLGQRLSGKVGNIIMTGNLQKANSSGSNSRKVAYTFFNSACYLASSEGFVNMLNAVEELKRAFKHGFNDRQLLEREMKEGKALFNMRDIIDLDNLRVDESNWKNIPKTSPSPTPAKTPAHL